MRYAIRSRGAGKRNPEAVSSGESPSTSGITWKRTSPAPQESYNGRTCGWPAVPLGAPDAESQIGVIPAAVAAATSGL